MEANALGCKVVDVEMIAILYASLPAMFALAIQIHAGKTNYQEICAGLLKWWMITHPGEAEADNSVSALAASANSSVKCGNCAEVATPIITAMLRMEGEKERAHRGTEHQRERSQRSLLPWQHPLLLPPTLLLLLPPLP